MTTSYKNIFGRIVLTFVSALYLSVSPAFLQAETLNASLIEVEKEEAIETLDPKIPSKSEEKSKESPEGDEFSDYEEIERHLYRDCIQEVPALIKAFEEKYVLSPYQSVFPSFKAFSYYKAEDGGNDLKALTEHLRSINTDPEMGAYLTYLSALEIHENSYSSVIKFFGIPAYEMRNQSVKEGILFWRHFLKTFPDHPYAKDAERRLRALYCRAANYELFKALLLYQEEAYIGAISNSYLILKEYPQSKAAVQSLLLLQATYERLKLPLLAKAVRELYIINKKKIASLEAKHSIAEWFRLAKDIEGGLPDFEDRQMERIHNFIRDSRKVLASETAHSKAVQLDEGAELSKGTFKTTQKNQREATLTRTKDDLADSAAKNKEEGPVLTGLCEKFLDQLEATLRACDQISLTIDQPEIGLVEEASVGSSYEDREARLDQLKDVRSGTLDLLIPLLSEFEENHCSLEGMEAMQVQIEAAKAAVDAVISVPQSK